MANGLEQVTQYAALMGEQFQPGDLADMQVIGRVQVIRLLPAMRAEVRTSKGDVLTVRVQLLKRVQGKA